MSFFTAIIIIILGWMIVRWLGNKLINWLGREIRFCPHFAGGEKQLYPPKPPSPTTRRQLYLLKQQRKAQELRIQQIIQEANQEDSNQD